MLRRREAWTAPERSLPVLHLHPAHCRPQFGGLEPLQQSVAEFALQGHLRAEGANCNALAQLDGSSLLLVQHDGGEQLLQLQLFFAHVTLSDQEDEVIGKPVIVLQTVEAAFAMRGSRPTLAMGDIELELRCSTNRYVCRQCMRRGLSGMRWSGADKKTHNVCLSCAPLKEPAETWLFVVDGDRSDAQAMISTMSAAGAIQENPQAEYQIEEETLGVGSNATVHLAERYDGHHDPESGKFAVKIFNSQKESREKELDALRAELSTLINVQTHPNIVQFYGVYHMDMSNFNRHAPNQPSANASPSGWSVIMEHCGGGDLFDAVSKNRFSEDRARKVMVGLLKALSHIHERGIVHRDVKPENVLLAQDDRAVLTDFGISCRVSDKTAMARKCGSPGYVAPEVLCGKASSIRIDSFSAGSLLHFLLAGKMPFHGSSIHSILSKTLRCEVDFKKNPYINSATKSCKDFISGLLCKSHKHRPTAQLALSNPWLLNVVGPEPQLDGCLQNMEDIRARRMRPRPQAKPFGQEPGPDVGAGPAPGQSLHMATRNMSDASTCSTNESSGYTQESSIGAANQETLNSAVNLSRETFMSSITDGLSMHDTASWSSSMLRDVIGNNPMICQTPSDAASCFSKSSSRSNRTDERTVSVDYSASVNSVDGLESRRIAMAALTRVLQPRAEGMRFFPENNSVPCFPLSNNTANEGLSNSTPSGSMAGEHLSRRAVSSNVSCSSEDHTMQSSQRETFGSHHGYIAGDDRPDESFAPPLTSAPLTYFSGDQPARLLSEHADSDPNALMTKMRGPVRGHGPAIRFCRRPN